MTWRDRPYAQGGEGGFGAGGLGFLKPTPAVLSIILTCLAVFVITAATRVRGNLFEWAELALPPRQPIWQVWRWVTYQYLHASVGHIFWNMLGLYFFGPPLERYWGARKFLAFYTFCGVVAGVGFALIQYVFYGGGLSPLVGASGSILGCLAGCAVLFPSMVVILLLFPVPIRMAAVLAAALFGLYILAEHDLAQAAHLAGMAGGVAWIWTERRWPNWRLGLGTRASTGEGAWQRKIRDLQEDEERVDRILDKIRKQGMGSLTWWEKRFLKQASERRRQFDEQQSRR